MNLSTRCPGCGTVFRVQPAQLSARAGKVRCGSCGQLFDGLLCLLQGEVAPAVEAAPVDSPQLALFETPAPGPAIAQPPLPAREPTELPAFLAPVARQRRGPWLGLLGLVGLLALLAQGVYHWRTEIAVLWPAARGPLATACAALGCELRLPRRPQLMAIESSDLQADSQRDQVIVLNAVLRNQAPFPQEYPALELTLNDERDQVVARRVLLPADYLAGSGAQRLGIGAGADFPLQLSIDASGLRAIGYRLYLFFP